VFKGSGHKFVGTREYAPGDDTRHIDWNSYAASGGMDLVVNEYEEPRDIQTYVLVSVDASMDFGTHRATKRHLAAELAASVLASVEESKDRCGLMLFSAKSVEKVMKATTPSRIRFPMVAGVIDQKPNENGPGDGLSRALKGLPNSKTLVFIISDFMNLSETDWEALHKASRRHDIRCFYVQDLRERELPDVSWGWGPIGWLMGMLGCFYTLQDSSGGRRTIWVNKKTRAQYAANWRLHESKINSRLVGSRCPATVVSTEEGDAAFQKIIQALSGRR
jgi:uncharacterized protein (DUF58 family)